MMSKYASDSERRAVIAAISQGQFSQVTHLFDEIQDISDRLTAIEQGAQASSATQAIFFKGAEPITVPPGDARGAEVRDSVVEIAELLNSIIEKVNG